MRILVEDIKELKRTGQFDNTLIVYSSDHGEMLGDHNRWNKGVPYQPSVGVPLVIAGPGVRKGWECGELTTTMDLAATFLEYGDLDVPSDMDSLSMKGLLEGRTNKHRNFVRSGLGPWRMVYDGRYKLIRGFDPDKKKLRSKDTEKKEPILLFDLREDPLEDVDFSKSKGEVVERLLAKVYSEKS